MKCQDLFSGGSIALFPEFDKENLGPQSLRAFPIHPKIGPQSQGKRILVSFREAIAPWGLIP